MTAATLGCMIREPDSTAGPFGDGSYLFGLQPTGKGGRTWTVETRPWEPGDPLDRFRVPVHPWDGGLRADRIMPLPNQIARTYGKANADTSNKGLLLWPPKLNTTALPAGSAPVKMVNFNGVTFIVGGQYMMTWNPTTFVLAVDKDFGAGNNAVDAAVFNNELVVAMGETIKEWRRTAAGVWTQTADATYLIAVGLVKNLLQRAETTNRLSSCSTTPGTLANWSPASPNQYYAGDSTFAVNQLIDYGGVPVAIKGDGVYFPDPNSAYVNQVPQLATWPNAGNGKNAWVAQGSLWVPTSRAVFRVRLGMSFSKGPEVTQSPTYRWRVRAGVEFGETYMYMVANDEAGSQPSCIIKAERDTEGYSNGLEYRYYQLASLGTTLPPTAIAVTTSGVNPHLCYTYGNAASGYTFGYLLLGRGGGRDVDDPLYAFGTAMSLESGVMLMTGDMAQVASPVGVKVVLDTSRAGESVTISGAVDRKKSTDAYTALQSIAPADGGGVSAISTVDGYDTVTRYFDAGVKGRFVEIKIEGTATAGGTGETRPVVRECWVFGYAHSEVTDIVSIAVIADDSVVIGGTGAGLGHADYYRIFKGWHNTGTELECDFEDYDPDLSRRFLVKHVQEDEVSVGMGPGGTVRVVSAVKVQLCRVDRAGMYGKDVAA